MNEQSPLTHGHTHSTHDRALPAPPSPACCSLAVSSGCHILLLLTPPISFSLIFSDTSKFNQPILPRGLINIQVFSPPWFSFLKIALSLGHLECISEQDGSVEQKALAAGL